MPRLTAQRQLGVGKCSAYLLVVALELVSQFACWSGDTSDGLNAEPDRTEADILLNTPGKIVDVDAHDDLGVLAREASPFLPPLLDVLDLRPTMSPWLVGRLALSSTPQRIRAVANHVYILTSATTATGATSRLIVVDVSVPTNPREVANVSLASWAVEAPSPLKLRDIAVADGRVYLAAQHGTEVFSVGNPAAPVFLGTLPTGDTQSVAAEFGRLYVSAWGHGDVDVYGTSSGLGQLLYPATLWPSSTAGSGRARMRLAALNRLVMTIDVGIDSVDATKDTEPLPVYALLRHAAMVGPVLDIEGTDVAVLSPFDATIHRFSVGPHGDYFEEKSQTIPGWNAPVPSPAPTLFAIAPRRAIVARGTQYTVVPLSEPRPCSVGVPLRVTYDSRPIDRYPNRQPWSADEIATLDRVLGLVRDSNGNATCIADRLFARLVNYLGTPDVETLPDGFHGFAINIVHDPSRIASSYGHNGPATLTLTGIDYGVLAHEMTHALTWTSYPSSSVLVTEGTAVATEMAIPHDLHAPPSFPNVDEWNAPGIEMFHGGAFNLLLQWPRYVSSGLFFLKQIRAAQAIAAPPYLATLRSLTRLVQPPPNYYGADVYDNALRAAAPACIEGKTSTAWLAGQQIFRMSPETPAIDIFALAPGIDLFSNGAWGELLPYKRELSVAGTGIEANPALNASLQIADPASFFNAQISGTWSLRDTNGATVGAANRPLVAQQFIPWTGIGIPTSALTTPTTDDNQELAPCAADSDGDGVRHCRSSRVATLRATWTDPMTGAVRVAERTQTRYLLRSSGYWPREPIIGVTSSLTSGKLRVTLTAWSVAFDVTIEGGTFRIPEAIGVPNMTVYSLAPAEPACTVLAATRPLCSLTAPAMGCPSATPRVLTEVDVRRYRGPVRVERMISTLGILTAARTWTKDEDELYLVY